MKKNLLSVLLYIVAFSSVVIAQPTLTGAGINPVVNDDYYTQYYTLPFSEGNSGANQTWTIMPTGTFTPAIIDAYLTSSTPYGSSFFASNVSLNNGSGYFDYYKTGTTFLRYYGSGSPGQIIYYTDPEEVLHFPFNMGNTFTDTWAFNFSGIARTATTTVTYDGYGTVILPSGTYNNVSRIHYTKTFNDVISSGSYMSYVDEYRWYLDGIHLPIASTFIYTDDDETLSSGSSILTNIVTTVSEQNNLVAHINSYPNPATNEINFELSDMINVVTVEIIDVAGKVIYLKDLSQNSFDKSLNVNMTDFKNGLYFAKFTLEDGQTLTKKINIVK